MLPNNIPSAIRASSKSFPPVMGYPFNLIFEWNKEKKKRRTRSLVNNSFVLPENASCPSMDLKKHRSIHT